MYIPIASVRNTGNEKGGPETKETEKRKTRNKKRKPGIIKEEATNGKQWNFEKAYLIETKKGTESEEGDGANPRFCHANRRLACMRRMIYSLFLARGTSPMPESL